MTTGSGATQDAAAAEQEPPPQTPLAKFCVQIAGILGVHGVALAIVTPDGRIGISAVSLTEAADRITAKFHEALELIAKGDEVVCIGCGGKKTINGFACLGCGGTGVARKDG